MAIPEIVSVAKAKAHLSELLKDLDSGVVYEVINHSEAVAILLSVDRYKALLAELEDFEDSLAVLEGRLEDFEKAAGSYREVMERYWAQHPDEAPISLEEFQRRYLGEHPDVSAP